MGMGICRRSALGLAGAIVAVALTLPAASVAAGEITEFATDADDLLQQGKPAEARDAFDKAAEAFWAASPLQIRTAVFASSVRGFGEYTPRTDTTFRSGESVTAYLEPFGYGFTLGNDGFLVSFTTGIEVRTAGGLVLAKADDFGRVQWQGRNRNHAVPLAITVTLPDLKPGNYQLVLTLTDAATSKSARVALPFAIAG